MGARARCSWRPAGSRRASGCSTWPRARGTSPSAPPRPARRVVASDLTPENFEAGRREARALRRRARVGRGRRPRRSRSTTARSTSSRRRSAPCSPPTTRGVGTTSLLRVCRPGGAIGMAQLHPRGPRPGTSSRRFARLRAPAPARCAARRILWGSEEPRPGALRRAVSTRSTLTRRTYVERAASPRCLLRALQSDLRTRHRNLRTFLADQPDRRSRARPGSPGVRRRARTAARPDGPAEYPYEYLLVVARKRGG